MPNLFRHLFRAGFFKISNVVNLTPLYISSEIVIPAKAGIQFINTGFRVKPGMTNKGKRFLTDHTREKTLKPVQDDT